MTDQPRILPASRWLLSAGLLVISLVALAPWWRNHNYLRDFYDYGLVIAALGRISRGELPYVDFLTPIQAGYFGLCWIVERIGGGVFRALTWGGAGLILLMSASLTLLLARRWPLRAALLVGAVVTVASASQHTILWHNSLGVFCLALVVWSAAAAPVFRRADWPWHLLLLAGLLVGGLNKLNFQLVALAAVVAWAVREFLTGRAGAGRFLATGALAVLAGLVLPVALELAWTGASLGVWRYNVLELAARSRAAPLREILSWKFLFAPIHDYYGPLLLPQVGLAGVVLSVSALVGCWPARAADRGSRRDLVFLPLAVLLSSAAGAALLATNQEIAYVGLAAWLVLITGVWLGFAAPARRWAFVGGLLLPAVLLGAAAWSSAWQGQRSQFGYSESRRADYLAATGAGPTFAYLAGLRVPPEEVQTLQLMEKWLPPAGADGLRPVFYGPGTEWLERVLPARKIPGQPLWIHWGTSYGPPEAVRLMQTLAWDLRFQVVLTTLARDQWPPELKMTLEKYYQGDLLGPVVRRWTRQPGLAGHFADSINFLNLSGGNVAGLVLRPEELPLGPLPAQDGKILLGITGGEGRLLLATPTYRFGGEAVLQRASFARPGPMWADYKIIVHGADPEEVRWAARLELPAGRPNVTVPFKLDSMGRNLQLRVYVPEEFCAQVSAGYRNLEITHAIESPGGPPNLRPEAAPDGAADEAMRAALFGDVAWRPQQLVVRGGRAASAGLELAGGGEVWLHSDGMGGDIRGQILGAGAPSMVRVVWYKGGRLQIMQQGGVPANGPFDFHVWSAEPGGWIGVLVDPGQAPVTVRVQGSTLVP